MPLENGKITAEHVAKIEPFIDTYQGEIRLGTFDGQIDEPYLKDVKIHFELKSDGTLVLNSETDWL